MTQETFDFRAALRTLCCRGRCPSSALRAAQSAVAPRNYPAGIASAQQNAQVLRRFPANSQFPNGPTESSAPTSGSPIFLSITHKTGTAREGCACSFYLQIISSLCSRKYGSPPENRKRYVSMCDSRSPVSSPDRICARSVSHSASPTGCSVAKNVSCIV